MLSMSTPCIASSVTVAPTVSHCPMCHRDNVTILDSHIWPQSLARKIKRESGKDKASSRIIVLAADENSPGPDKFRWMQDVPHEDMLCSECEVYSHRIETPALNMLRREILPHLRHMRSNNGIIPLV